MSNGKKQRKRQLSRIYYGPDGRETSMYWTVPVTDAKKPVTINGSAAAALRAHRGKTVGCALSLAGMENAEQFGHDVYLISVTKSTMLVVDRLNKDGSPAHAVRYGHGYGEIIDSNDDGTLKKIVKERPEIMERPFHLRPPRKRPTGPHGEHTRTSVSGAHRVYAHQRGALARAVKAKRIGKNVAQQLSVAMSRQSKQPADSREQRLGVKHRPRASIDHNVVSPHQPHEGNAT